MKKTNTKKIVTIAMLIALSYTLAAMVRFPLLPHVPFIRYSPSDIPIIIGGLIFGPFWTFIMTLIVSILRGMTLRHYWNYRYCYEHFFYCLFCGGSSSNI